MATLNEKNKEFFFSKTTEAVGLLFGTNVKWVRAVENCYKSANLLLGMVAMATENFRKIYACNDLSTQFRKIILRYKKIGYNINVI